MIQLAGIFQSGMTLQRYQAVAIWGKTSQPQCISLYLDDRLMARDDFAAGPFRLTMPMQEAGEDHVLTVTGSAGDRLVADHVDIGEVWIAGGQSNMELAMRDEQHLTEALGRADDPHLRFYDTPRYAFDGEEADGFKESLGFGIWRQCTRQDLPFFSAAGYYFARQIREQLHVPAAIIGCTWGGTSASVWLDETILQDDKMLAVYWHTYQDGLKKINLDTYQDKNRKARQMEMSSAFQQMMRKLIHGDAGLILRGFVRFFRSVAPEPVGPLSPHRPGGLYHTMVKKIMGYACRGVIWYQGESDADHAPLYGRLFTRVIECWRRGWGKDLPFLFVQLAPFQSWLDLNGQHYPEIRAQQEYVSKTVPGTAMASIMDAGMRYDIHPKNKKVVGERLALLARCKVYGEDILCEAPEAAEAVRRDDTIVIRFRHAGSGLSVAGSSINALSVMSGKKLCRISHAEVEGDKLILRSDNFRQTNDLVIHFADTPYCEVNLYNSGGLPARPFVLAVSTGSGSEGAA